MKNSLIAGLGVAVLVTFPTFARCDEVSASMHGSGEVVVTSGGGAWEAAQKAAFYDPFTRDTGIKVVLVPEDHAKLLSSTKLGQPDADVTSIPGAMLGSFVDKDAVEEIDYKYFSTATLKQIPEKLKNKYGIGALLYSIAVGFNTDVFPKGKQPVNWVDFYDTDKFKGPRSLPKCEKMVDGGLLEGALMGDGVPADKVYPIDIDRAFAKLEKIKPSVGRWWLSGADAPQSLVSGEVDLAATYNGRIFDAQKEGAPLALSWDQSLLQYDYWVIMKGSPNKENAAKLLAYISQEKPQAAFAKAISYGPINTGAFKLVPPDMLAILPGSPELEKKQLFQDYDWWNAKAPDGRRNWDVALERCVGLLSQ